MDLNQMQIKMKNYKNKKIRMNQNKITNTNRMIKIKNKI